MCARCSTGCCSNAMAAITFDMMSVDGEDLPGRPLVERNQRLLAIIPADRIEGGLHESTSSAGSELFAAVCEHEGIVATWKLSRYCSDGMTTSWLKIPNPSYSQVHGRLELFGARRMERHQEARSQCGAPNCRRRRERDSPGTGPLFTDRGRCLRSPPSGRSASTCHRPDESGKAGSAIRSLPRRTPHNR
jgi:hypothetical protein